MGCHPLEKHRGRTPYRWTPEQKQAQSLRQKQIHADKKARRESKRNA